MNSRSLNERSILPEDRRAEIGALIKATRVDFELWKKACEEDRETPEPIDLRKPSWETFATTNPIAVNGRKSKGIRGCIAVHKVPCAYKMDTEGNGCTHCGLSKCDEFLTEVNSRDQIFATESALTGITNLLGATPPVIEFIPHGNTLNDEEIAPETRTGIFNLVAKNDSIVKLAIESRPQYITVQEIKRLLSLLRDDQILGIYVGLESVDPFVLNEIINKGFTIGQFEKKIQEVADGLSTEEKNRLHFTVYHLFKPPYLTERESIEAAVVMGNKVKEYDEKTGIHFAVKYEPTVISDETLQKYLFEKDQYTPPNYFSIAEAVARSHEMHFSDKIAIGQRDDIDCYYTVAGVPDMNNPKMFSPFDYMVYNAVQRFNADQDIWGFCADMSDAVENAPEFKKWEVETYGQVGASALSRLFAEYKKRDFNHKYDDRINFQRKLWRILEIEYNAKLSEQLCKRGNEGISQIKAEFISLFLKADIKILQFKSMKFIDVGKLTNSPKLEDVHPDFADMTEDAVCQAEVIIEDEVGLPQNIWVKIPLKTTEYNPSRFPFVYSE